MRTCVLLLLGALAGSVLASACTSGTSRTTHPSVAARDVTTASSCALPTFGPGNRYRPVVDPASFSPAVDNRYFPLTPGTTSVYTGVKDGKKALDIVAVSQRTAVVDGVRTRVVEDRLYLDNVLEERTSDYYAQDRCRNVWYFGEDTATLDPNGKVLSTDGSFRAGTAGAQPGVFMQATPELGRRFRQEWSPGNAEDTFNVIDLDGTVSVPFGHSDHALRTEETTALEPDVVDNKAYVSGVGEVLEQAVRGPAEVLRLVEVIR
jgi:hypothetical protein